MGEAAGDYAMADASAEDACDATHDVADKDGMADGHDQARSAPGADFAACGGDSFLSAARDRLPPSAK